MSNYLFIGERLPQECIDDLNDRIQKFLSKSEHASSEKSFSSRRFELEIAEGSNSQVISRPVIRDLAQSRYVDNHTRDEYLYLEFTLEGIEWTIYAVSVPVVPYSGECTRSKTVWRDLPQGMCELLWDFAKERIPTLER